MAVEIYLGRLFRNGHERRAFGKFVKDLVNRFEQVDEQLYFVVAEVDANGASMDLLLLSSRVIIIADLKELTAAEETDAGGIHLAGKENGQWEYYLPGNSKPVPMGGSRGKDKNPYKQLERMRYFFANWLTSHYRAITGQNLKSGGALDMLKAWVVISPGFDEQTDHLDLPWDQIHFRHDWFRVIPLDKLAWEFHATTNRFELTERQMREFIAQLGATRLEHLGQVLPDYFPEDLPPAPPSTLFTRPWVSRHLIGREKELACLLDYLNDPNISLLCVKGLGGVGKSELVGAAVPLAEDKGWQVRWVECREKELTIESLLAAIAAEVNDPVKANLIIDKNEVKMVDRLDTALDFFEQEKTLLFFDDFHKVARQQDLEPLFDRIMVRSERLKIILIGREHPVSMDNPSWPLGSVKDIILEGLEKKDIPHYLEAHGIVDLDREQLALVWDRTQGNPYAMGLLKPLLRKYGWGELVTELPLYQNDKNHWFDSLMETIGSDAQQLASRLSVIRSSLSQEMINFLSHDPKKAQILIVDLVENFVLQPCDQAGNHIAHEFIREYLYDHLPDQKRLKAHVDAAKYYRDLANRAADDFSIADALFEAIYHFQRAENLREIHDLAPRAFDLLYLHGDWTRAYQVSTQALKVARALKAPLEISRWLMQVAGWEFDHDLIKEAGLHLKQALEQLPKIGSKTSEEEKRKILLIEAQIFLEKGRIDYNMSELERASEHFERAQKAAKQSEDEMLYCDCLMRIGRVERHRGQFAAAQAHFEEVREIAARLDLEPFLVQAVSHMGLIARQQGDLESARRFFTQAYETAQNVGDWRGTSINRSLLADLARRQQNYQEAEYDKGYGCYQLRGCDSKNPKNSNYECKGNSYIQIDILAMSNVIPNASR